MSNVLEKLFQQYSHYYRPGRPETAQEKRDEIVHVHKYFDKEPEGHHKRRFGGEADDSQNRISYLKNLSPLYPDLTGSDLTMDDVKVLQYYLNQLDDRTGSNDRSGYGYEYPESTYGIPLAQYMDPRPSGDMDDTYSSPQWNEAGDIPLADQGRFKHHWAIYKVGVAIHFLSILWRDISVLMVDLVRILLWSNIRI